MRCRLHVVVRLMCLIVLPALSACESRPGATNGGTSPGVSGPTAASTDARQETASGKAKTDASPPEATRNHAMEAAQAEQELRTRQLAIATQAVEAGKWDEAASVRKELQTAVERRNLPKELLEQVAKLDEQIAAGREAETAQVRQERLDQARQWLAAGRLEDAQQALRDVLTRGPTDEQRESAQAMTQELERVRQARRQLKSWLSMLSSKEEREVQTAQSQLLQDPDTATGMLLEALRSTSDEALGRTYLDTLRQFDRHAVVTPAILEMLQDDTRKPLWPLFTSELPQLAGPSAGAALLKLAETSTDAAQQAAALDALASGAAPPTETLFVLAPRLSQAAPALQAKMLRAVIRAVAEHGQRDWAARRDWPDSLSPETIAALDQLPTWLEERAKATGPEAAEVARESRRLRAILALDLGQPLTGVKVERVEGESPESPGSALVDGIWKSVDPKTMWRHPIDRRGSVLLDLGESRMVTAIRVWNWNEPSGAQRGWKEVEVFVSDNPAELTPVATGVILPAPGAADTPDYGALLPLPAPQGRYVRLQAKSTWTTDSHSGLSEIQIWVAP